MKALVTYFSAEGTTAKVAKAIAETVGADLYEIKPEVPYTAADIKWTNPLARCNREWLGKKEVPVAGRVENMADYDTLYVGFPIWYGCAPLVVNTLLRPDREDHQGICYLRRQRPGQDSGEAEALCGRRRDRGRQAAHK